MGAGTSSRTNSSRKRANSFTATAGGAGTSNDTAEKPGEIIKPLKLGLEELYRGVTKKLKVTRKLLSGKMEEKVVEINVRFISIQ